MPGFLIADEAVWRTNARVLGGGGQTVGARVEELVCALPHPSYITYTLVIIRKGRNMSYSQFVFSFVNAGYLPSAAKSRQSKVKWSEASDSTWKYKLA